MITGESAARQEGEVILRLLPNGDIWVEQYSECEQVPPKNITVEDFKKAWFGSYKESFIVKDERSGILPQNCVEYITFYSGDSAGHIVIIDVPKAIRPFTIEGLIDKGKTTYGVGYPRLLFQFVIIDMRIDRLRVRAVAGTESLQPNTRMCLYPYTNVYSEGQVCMGGYKFPPLTDLRQLNSCIDFFFRMENASHVYQYQASMTLSEMVKINMGREFDDSLLLECKSETYEQFAGMGIKVKETSFLANTREILN